MILAVGWEVAEARCRCRVYRFVGTLAAGCDATDLTGVRITAFPYEQDRPFCGDAPSPEPEFIVHEDRTFEVRASAPTYSLGFFGLDRCKRRLRRATLVFTADGFDSKRLDVEIKMGDNATLHDGDVVVQVGQVSLACRKARIESASTPEATPWPRGLGRFSGALGRTARVGPSLLRKIGAPLGPLGTKPLGPSPWPSVGLPVWPRQSASMRDG